MNTLVSKRPTAQKISFEKDLLVVDLKDGRQLKLPLSWYPKLLAASPAERNQFETIGKGEGFYWPFLDEHLSVRGFLQGQKPPQ